MTTIEDFRRMAALAGERALVAALPTPPRIPADLLADIEKAAGIATADTSKEATAP